MIQKIDKKSGGVCKKTCIKYLAKKPVKGSRYETGQVRCQICEIYMIPEGTMNGGRFCKCCHYRVRTKPRNKKYKEILREKLQNTTNVVIPADKKDSTETSEIKIGSVKNDNRQLEKSTKQRLPQEIENYKKSTPIYEEIDESLKTFYEFKEFLELGIKLQANYQLVMIKELLEYGKLHKGEIAESLAYFNNEDSSDFKIVSNYFNVPVYDILLKHKIVIESGIFYNQCPYYLLNVKLTEHEKNAMLDYVTKSLTKYNTEHNILENEFPSADNMGCIDWDNIHYNAVHNHETNLSHELESNPNENNTNMVEKSSIESSSVKSKDMSNFYNKQKICIDCKKNEISITQFSDICDKCKDESKNAEIEEKSKSRWDNQILNSYDLMIVGNFPNGVGLDKFKKVKSDFIKKDDILSNDQLIEKFGVGNMGGIRYSKKNNLLVLLSTFSNDYNDTIDLDSGMVIYSGEGREGDQEIKKGNEKILNSKNIPMLLFKEKFQDSGVRKRGALDNVYTFVGIVEYQKHYWKSEGDRQIIKFVLEIKS